MCDDTELTRPVFVVCRMCGGEGSVSTEGYCPEYFCTECSGTGAVEEEAQPITLDDLDEMDADEIAAGHAE